MDLLADMIRFSTFDPQELERERGVILQEIGQYQDTPDEIIFDHAQEAAFPGQLVGRPILGTPETVGRLSRQDLIDYRDPRYRPSRMVAVAAGKVDHQAFLDLVEKYYGDLPKDETPFAAPETARFSGGDCMQSRELEQLHLIMAFEGVAYGRPEYEAHAVYSSVLAGACRRVCSRKCVKNAAWSIASILMARRCETAACLAFMRAPPPTRFKN